MENVIGPTKFSSLRNKLKNLKNKKLRYAKKVSTVSSRKKNQKLIQLSLALNMIDSFPEINSESLKLQLKFKSKNK